MSKAVVGNQILTGGKLRPACLLVGVGGRIDDVQDALPAHFKGEVEDFGDLVVMPGLCDTHVHINEPGRTEWEGFETATQAAAAGGVTTVVDMPLNCIPVTTSKQAFTTKLEALSGKLWVDAGFWGGVTPQSLKDLPELLKSGILGVKSFLIDSGIEEFQPMTANDLEKAMPQLAAAGMPYLFHAEMHAPGAPEAGQSYESFLASRPRAWENSAVELVLKLTEKYGGPSHIVHLSSSDVLSKLHEAKKRGVNISAETCPHYLVLDSEGIESGDLLRSGSDGKTLFKCCPPIREKENQDKLWNALKTGDIDYVVSDHSPCTPQLKLLGQGDFAKAWGGISGLQFTLPLVWTHGKKHGIDVATLSRWLSSNPARRAGLADKGSLEKNFDADFVVWNPEEEISIDARSTYHKNKPTPYAGWKLKGRVHATYLRGRKIFENGKPSPKPAGKTLLRNV